MSNLARKYQEQQRETQSVQDQREIKIKKSWLTPGEKIIGVAFAGLVCFGAVHLISNEAKIYSVNKDIQQVEQNITDQQKVNNDLQVKVSELSSYERIFEKAAQMGLTRENNVKVVQGK